MARKAPRNVATATIWPGHGGFRITGRDETGKVIYDSPRAFPGRIAAKKAALKLWPEVKFIP